MQPLIAHLTTYIWLMTADNDVTYPVCTTVQSVCKQIQNAHMHMCYNLMQSLLCLFKCCVVKALNYVLCA